MKKLTALTIALLCSACGISPEHVAWLASHKTYYESRGFEVVGSQGYNFLLTGKCHWYTLSRQGTLYQSCLLYWNGETHEYSLQAVDAIKGTSK